MAKKKNPEQETEQPTEEQQAQETETGTEESDEETQEQETAPETEEESEEQDEDSEQPEEEQPGNQQDNPAAGGADESASLRQDLLQARGELAAYRAGVAPAMVQDAVTLAMAEAAKSGEVTEAAVTKALEAVLKRHPEWKAAEDGNQKSGGFKLGADRDSGGTYKKTSGTNNQNMKRWNRFK